MQGAGLAPAHSPWPWGGQGWELLEKAGLASPVPPLPSSSEMMGHPDLLPEVDVSSLGPLISPELVDQTERRYVVKLKVSEEVGSVGP